MIYISVGIIALLIRVVASASYVVTVFTAPLGLVYRIGEGHARH